MSVSCLRFPIVMNGMGGCIYGKQVFCSRFMTHSDTHTALSHCTMESACLLIDNSGEFIILLQVELELQLVSAITVMTTASDCATDALIITVNLSLPLYPQTAAIMPQPRMMLVVTGDDFGYCPQRNQGIVDCFQAGGISNVSLLVNASAAKEAVDLAKRC